jgi:TRAP-type C4-dicarboxylate transport system substrate-binding protein
MEETTMTFGPVPTPTNDLSFTRTTKAERQQLLEAAQTAQTFFWEALHELESAYDDSAEISGAEDLDEFTVETLDRVMMAAGTVEYADELPPA